MEKYEYPNNMLTQLKEYISKNFKIENIDEWLYKIEPVLVMKSGITYSDLNTLSWRQIYAHYEMYVEEVKRENERIKRENAQNEKDRRKAESDRRKQEAAHKAMTKSSNPKTPKYK